MPLHIRYCKEAIRSVQTDHNSFDKITGVQCHDTHIDHESCKDPLSAFDLGKASNFSMGSVTKYAVVCVQSRQRTLSAISKSPLLPLCIALFHVVGVALVRDGMVSVAPGVFSRDFQMASYEYSGTLVFHTVYSEMW